MTAITPGGLKVARYYSHPPVGFLRNFVITIFGEEYFKIETMSTPDENSHTPFLRNEFSKIFEDFLQ